MSSSSIALAPARRLSDLLSSGTGADDKAKRKAMEQQARSDEDQQLVARTQAAEAAAFDQLVVKYTPRLYGLVYNMTSNHEDTNDLLQDVFAKAYKAIRGFRGKSSFYTWIHSIAVNMTLNFLKTGSAVSPEPGRRRCKYPERQGVPRTDGHEQSGAGGRPF